MKNAKSDHGPQEQVERVASTEPSTLKNGEEAVHADETETGDGISRGGERERIDRLEAENADLKDRLLRALAEVENVRRRTEKDIGETAQYAIAKFAGDMLHVADNMERAIDSVPAGPARVEGSLKALIEGVQLTEKEMLQVFEKHGIKKIEPVGQRFDPNFHEALFEVPDASVPSGTVSKVVEPGYSIGTRPLRAAKVAIARGGPLQGKPAKADSRQSD